MPEDGEMVILIYLGHISLEEGRSTTIATYRGGRVDPLQCQRISVSPCAIAAPSSGPSPRIQHGIRWKTLKCWQKLTTLGHRREKS